MTIQSPAPEIHRIVEKFIATVVCDEIEWDAYGTVSTKCEPEVIQIALKGSPIDISFKLSNETIAAVQAACERLWLAGNLDDSEFYKSLNKEEE